MEITSHIRHERYRAQHEEKEGKKKRRKKKGRTTAEDYRQIGTQALYSHNTWLTT